MRQRHSRGTGVAGSMGEQLDNVFIHARQPRLILDMLGDDLSDHSAFDLNRPMHTPEQMISGKFDIKSGAVWVAPAEHAAVQVDPAIVKDLAIIPYHRRPEAVIAHQIFYFVQ